MTIDFYGLFLMKALSFACAFALILIALWVTRHIPWVQRIAAPLWDGVARMEQRADAGMEGANIGLGVAYGTVTAATILGAALLGGVAH